MKKWSAVLGMLLMVLWGVPAQVRVWSVDGLKSAKAEQPVALMNWLIRDADRELKKSITTVMDKDMTAPSGDKHDYMSMGRYWWPDPSRKDGLPYIRKDGVVNHEIDKLDRSPLSLMAKSVRNLSLAYYLTNDWKYAQKAAENLRIWFLNPATRMNPNMNYGQVIPGRKDGNGRGEGVIDTYSFLEMLDGVELLKSSKALTKSDLDGLTGWFSNYLNWLLTSDVAKEEYDSKNNHGTAYDVQVVRYALFVGRTEVATKFISQFPEKRIFAQIEPDGKQPLELARTTGFGYSLFNLTHMLDMCSLAQSMGVNLFDTKSADGRSLSKAVDYISQFQGKEPSDFPYKQIKEWDKQQENLCWVLHKVTRFSKDQKYQHMADTCMVVSPKDLRYYLD